METLDYKQAAAYLHISPNTLRNWLFMGKEIPYYKAGRRVLFFREELEEWLRKGENSGKGGEK